MKYKILVTGKATSVIDDLFTRRNDCFELMTTSLRHEDIIAHIKYFQPDMLLYCMYNEIREDLNKIVSLKYMLNKSHAYIAVFGSQTDCTEFERDAVNVSNLTLVKPMTVDIIQEKIQLFLETRKPLNPSNQDKSAVGPSGNMTPSYPDMATAAVQNLLSTRKHILVVDDDPRMLKMLKEQLHSDYDVATAVSGKVALKFLSNKHTDLILLDYEMPEEKGPEVLEKIRENPQTKDVPVIFLTGITEKEKIQKALVLKPQGYLLKPINRNRLMETIEKVMEG